MSAVAVITHRWEIFSSPHCSLCSSLQHRLIWTAMPRHCALLQEPPTAAVPLENLPVTITDACLGF